MKQIEPPKVEPETCRINPTKDNGHLTYGAFSARHVRKVYPTSADDLIIIKKETATNYYVKFVHPDQDDFNQVMHIDDLVFPEVQTGDQSPEIIESFDGLATPPIAGPQEPTAPMTKNVLELFRKKGSLTALEAGGVLKCRSLPFQVLKLKELGHEITTQLKRDPMDEQRYARYHYIPTATAA